MAWSMAIMDDGITNALQAQVGNPTFIEYDYYFDFPDTDDGIPNTHGDNVFLSALAVSSAYDVLDLKVASAEFGDYLAGPIERALADVLATDDVAIGAINMSFAGPDFPSAYADEISLLASRGVLSVVAAGNAGSHAFLENPSYPAALPEVICVGSHDGFGNPSSFSQNGPAVDILADGEDMPGPDAQGTSFAAPRVSATVTRVQAIVEGLTGWVLGVDGMVDALQQGGAGPVSNPDPADGATRYFLHDHAGSLDYAWFSYGGSPGTALAYIASHVDLIAAFGADAEAGRLHYVQHGSVEGRAISFSALEYVASSGDLITAFGANREAASSHYIAFGQREGRPADSFDAERYLEKYADLRAALGTDEEAAATHFITTGYHEGRTDDLEAATGAADFFL
jgi:Subtilase family